MTKQALDLLSDLRESADRGAFAMACDGRATRKAAHELEQLGYADWKGTQYGSSFYAITAAGRAAAQ